MQQRAATLLLIDDHPLFHAGLATVLQSRRPAYHLLSAGDAAAGLEMIGATGEVDLVLLDIVLPGADGFDAVTSYGRAYPSIPRVLISGREDRATLLRASRSGASGFISKAWPPSALTFVIDRVLDGGAAFDAYAGDPDQEPMGEDGGGRLTQRQLEVLSLLAQGKCNKEIARRLDIADRTVRAHLTDLFQALGVQSRVQAILHAQRLGLIE
jgi:DNA-binding NarL/FixJ family response regulator